MKRNKHYKYKGFNKWAFLRKTTSAANLYII